MTTTIILLMIMLMSFPCNSRWSDKHWAFAISKCVSQSITTFEKGYKSVSGEF